MYTCSIRAMCVPRVIDYFNFKLISKFFFELMFDSVTISIKLSKIFDSICLLLNEHMKPHSIKTCIC